MTITGLDIPSLKDGGSPPRSLLLLLFAVRFCLETVLHCVTQIPVQGRGIPLLFAMVCCNSQREFTLFFSAIQHHPLLSMWETLYLGSPIISQPA